jgi:hypothetical protein
MAGFFHGCGVLCGLACCTPEFGFSQKAIVDFSAAGIAHWSRMTNTTAPRG